MLRTACILGCVLAIGQPGEHTEWPLAPQLNRGLELVYRGAVREQTNGRGVQFTKTYDLDLRALVLETGENRAEVAFLTKLAEQKPLTVPKAEAGEAASVRLEVAEVDSLGRLTSPGGVATALSIDGPATWESGFLVEVPKAQVSARQKWQVVEKGRPPRHYQVAGTEAVGGTTCIKLLADQQSEDWDKPQASQTAWRRRDTIWLAPRLGIAYKVERILERREPAHKEASYISATTYRLDSSLSFAGDLLEDRRRDISQARQFQEKIQELLQDPRRAGPKAFEAIGGSIDRHLEKYPTGTPYRDALLRARNLAIAAGKGQAPAQLVELPARERLAIGKPAPEFITEDLVSQQNVSLRKWKGKTLLLLFFHPNSVISPDVFRYVKELLERHGEEGLTVVALAMSDDIEAVKKVAGQHDLTFPTLAGKSLRVSYDVDATPRLVLMDREGIVRGAHTGWGPEVPAALSAELKKCLAK